MLKNTFRFRLLFIICFVLTVGTAFSQKQGIAVSELRKNAIYATGGTALPMDLYFSLMGNYERMIMTFPKGGLHSLWVRAGGGPWVAWGSSGVNYVSTISALFCRRSAHIETGPGVIFTYWPGERGFHPIVNNRHIAGFLGFRYQKPGDYFVFRTGLGWPEGFYASLGVCF